jgi:hypothetical protein
MVTILGLRRVSTVCWKGLEGFGGALASKMAGACEKNTEVTKYTKTRLDLPFESATDFLTSRNAINGLPLQNKTPSHPT